MNTTAEERIVKKDDGLDFKQILLRLSHNWYWILLSIIVCLSISYLYLKFKSPSYKISARVLVNDEKKGAAGGLMAGAEMLGDLSGLLGAKSTVDNEAEILKTRFLMEQVVKDMNLNITYFTKQSFKSTELYKSPFNLKIVTPLDTISATEMEVKLNKSNQLAISTEDIDTVVNFNKPFRLPKVGVVEFSRNAGVPEAGNDYDVNIVSIDAKVADLMEVLSVEVRNKLITIIDVSMIHPIPKKGEDILAKLIDTYVKANLRDKNEIADSTVKFIQNRLAYIGGELGDLEGNIQGFKQKNNLADMTEQSKLLVQTSSEYVSELSKIETQISILKSLQQYMKDDSKNKRVLPSSLIPADLVFSGAVEKYNELTLERARRLIGMTEANPSIVLIDKEIANARADIQANLSTTLDGFVITRNKLNSQINQAESKVRDVPAIERNYLNLARQQQIKQELYIFLMQKSEETAISKTSNIAISKTIDPPKSEVQPFSPKKPMVYVLGMFLGLLIPVSFIYLMEITNDKIQTKEDIERITNVPVIGEISRHEDSDSLAVANSSRSAVSEQFRALRTNLSFYMKSSDARVILMTSSMSGEGKSFVAVNLANILALSNKKVVLMELDLRKPGLSIKLKTPNDTGFTNYIINDELTAKDIIKPLSIHKNLSLVSSGPVPPNPAEMLLSDRTKELIEELKLQFDYVIIDAPPIGVVADAQMLSAHADVCIYLVRQNVTSKHQLNILEELRASEKIKGLGIVVNDITGRGYGYGKGYGYGYGYGSYGEDAAEKNWFKKLFKS
ncbi:putative tyrosine-protein kinase in cps region [Pedobacter sp. BAL39]|uniref:GumC family protein n=1 Tax=Pedobacter sp. BAL39 TaxID=391596 RepID=UPI0001559473|nr:tyrosine-protein kinase [Pedobacter sp. BAL39]EDM34781.1 putative tyrosine-protein kinase in cps region [Pedobacter sp. BAL39]